MTMKIVHIISNKVWGGGEQYVFDLCETLVAEGNHVEIFAPSIPSITKNIEKLDIPIIRYTFFSLLRLDNCIVHVHNFKDALKAVIAKTLARRNTTIIVTRHLVRPAKTSRLYTWVYSQAKKIIFVSEIAQKEFLSSNPDIDATKTCVVRNSIKQREIFQSEDIRKTLASDAVVLMYHGRIAKEKGLDVLIDSLLGVVKLRWHLFIIGTGDNQYVDSLRRQIDGYNMADRISFLGFKNDVLPYIRQTDIGIIPSVAREACGLSCMEYMMMGKCLITTHNGGQAEYIKNGETGFLVSPNSPDELSAAICKAVGVKDVVGREAQRYFNEHLSYDIFYAKIMDIYHE